MKQTSNHDLHIMITKIDAKLDTVLEKHEDAVRWRNKHESSDDVRFTTLSDKLDNVNKFGVSIAAVFGFIGIIIGKYFGEGNG